MDTSTPQHGEEGEPHVGDLLVGREPIKAYLIELGMPKKTDPYYLRRQGSWPIRRLAEERSLLLDSIGMAIEPKGLLKRSLVTEPSSVTVMAACETTPRSKTSFRPEASSCAAWKSLA